MNLTTVVFLIIGALTAFASGHENDKSHHLQRAHHRNHHHNGNLAYRHAVPQGLELFLNSTSGLIGLLNVTNHVAVVFDLSTSSVVVYNGLGGNAIAIDGHTHDLRKISGIWSLKNGHFDEYFRSLSSLDDVVRMGQKVNREEVEPELTRLAAELGVESNAMEYLVGAASNLHQVAVVLRQLIREDRFKARGSLLRITTVLKGIGDLFIAKPQDLEQLSKSGNHLDLPAIINAPNGLQAFLRILQSLGKINMRPMMGNILGNIDMILHIIVELGGNDSDNGIDNVFRIIYHIFGFIHGHGCLDCLIHALIDAAENGGIEINGADITPVVDDLLKLAETQNSMFQSGGIFNTFIEFLRFLNTNNLMLNDINISELLQVLRKGDYKGAVDMIVRFFMHFNNILNPAKTIPRFFGYLLSFLSTARGGRLLPKFLPGVNSDQLSLLQGFNISSLGFGNFSNNPIVEQLYHQCNHSVGSASNGTVDFSSLFNQGGAGIFQPPVFGRFIGFFQPLQSFASFSPLPGSFQSGWDQGGGGGGIPLISSANITNIIVNTAAPCNNSITSETDITTTTERVFTTLLETTTEVTETDEARAKKRNHHGHGRKGSRHHHGHEKQHNKHLKHHSKHHETHQGKHHTDKRSHGHNN